MAAPRQEPDRLGELPVGFLRHVRRVREQLARRLRIELRVGPQEGEELRHRPLEVRLLLGGLHLGLDARDLFQADVVNLLRRQRQRRVLLDLRLVERIAIGHRAGGERRASLHQILVAHHRQSRV